MEQKIVKLSYFLTTIDNYNWGDQGGLFMRERKWLFSMGFHLEIFSMERKLVAGVANRMMSSSINAGDVTEMSAK